MKRQEVTERLIAKAKEMRKRGMTQEAIAAELRLAQGTISRILRERRPRRQA
jgi:predicted transcriptional regulator